MDRRIFPKPTITLNVKLNIKLEAAELNNVDAIFNLGSLYLLPSSLYLERNVKKGRALIEKAALLDHRLA